MAALVLPLDFMFYRGERALAVSLLSYLEITKHRNVKTNSNSTGMEALNRNWTLGLAAWKVLVPVCSTQLVPVDVK